MKLLTNLHKETQEFLYTMIRQGELLFMVDQVDSFHLDEEGALTEGALIRRRQSSWPPSSLMELVIPSHIPGVVESYPAYQVIMPGQKPEADIYVCRLRNGDLTLQAVPQGVSTMEAVSIIQATQEQSLTMLEEVEDTVSVLDELVRVHDIEWLMETHYVRKLDCGPRMSRKLQLIDPTEYSRGLASQLMDHVGHIECSNTPLT